jgi:hypothetical protein
MGEEENPKNTVITFQQVRTSDFRIVHADGAWGAISSAGNIILTFYNERPIVPDSVKYHFDANSNFVPAPENFKPEFDRLVLRQFEVETVMTYESAKVIHEVLGNFIGMYEQAREAKKRTT